MNGNGPKDSHESGFAKIDISNLSIDKIKELILNSKSHNDISKKISELLNAEGGKDKIRLLCKDYFAKLEKFDIQDVQGVTMIQILAKSFGLNVYTDGLYGRQTKEALENILRLNKDLEPPIITFPAKIDETKLASYRKGKDEDSAVEKLNAEYSIIKNDPEKLKKFEKEVSDYKIDIQTIKLGKESIKSRVDNSGAKISETKDSNESSETKEIKKIIDRAIKENFALSIVQATYNSKEGNIYVIEEGNPDSPIILNLNELKDKNNSIPLDEVISKALESTKSKLESFEMPAWGKEKGAGQMSAKGMLDVWGDKPVLDMSDKLKIQKLKNMVKTIDKLDIKDEYKINLLNKYLSDGSDMSARLNDVIKTLQNLSIIKKQIPDKNKGNFDRILDDLLSDFTLFKSNSKQFLEKINSISGGNIRGKNYSEVLNKEYMDKFFTLDEYNPDISKLLRRKIQESENGDIKELLDNIMLNGNLQFIKEYSEFFKVENGKGYDKDTKEMLNAYKKRLDQGMLLENRDSTYYFYEKLQQIGDIKNDKIFKGLEKYKTNTELYDILRKSVIKSLENGKASYSGVMDILENAEKIDNKITELSKQIKYPHLKKRLPSLEASILSGENNQSVLEKIAIFDQKIVNIKDQKGQEFLDKTLKINSLISETFTGNKELGVLIDQLETIVNLPLSDNPEIYERLIDFSLKKGEYFSNGNTPYGEIMKFFVEHINKFKGTNYSFVSSENKTNLVLQLAKGNIPERRFETIVNQFAKMNEKVSKGQMTPDNAKKIVSSLISDKISFNGETDIEEKTEEEKTVISKLEIQISEIKLALKKAKTLKEKKDLRNQLNESIDLLEHMNMSEKIAKKMTTETLDFILNDFGNPENKQKFMIPDGVFDNEKEKDGYSKAIENSLVNGEINHKDVRYIYEILFNKDSEQFTGLNKLSIADKTAFLNNIVTGVISYEPALSHMDKSAGITKKTLNQKVDFMLKNYERLDELNTIPEGVYKPNYVKHIPNIRASFMGGYLATEEQFAFKLKTYKEGKLDKLVAGINSGEEENSLFVYSKAVKQG